MTVSIKETRIWKMTVGLLDTTSKWYGYRPEHSFEFLLNDFPDKSEFLSIMTQCYAKTSAKVAAKSILDASQDPQHLLPAMDEVVRHGASKNTVRWDFPDTKTKKVMVKIEPVMMVDLHATRAPGNTSSWKKK